MAARGSILGRKQEDAIAALFIQRNIEEAARPAGIGPRTLLRWLKLPEFQKVRREARRDAFGQAIARLQQGTSAAATINGGSLWAGQQVKERRSSIMWSNGNRAARPCIRGSSRRTVLPAGFIGGPL